MRIIGYLFLFLSFSGLSQVQEKHVKKLEKLLSSGQPVFHIKDEVQGLKLEPVSGYFDRKESIGFTSQKALSSYISERPVLISEFNDFRNQVIDSVCRERVYFYLDDDEEAAPYLVYEELYDEGSLEHVKFDPSERELNRSLYRLNYKKRFNYEDPELRPLLADFYVPHAKRLYRQNQWLEKKFVFRYYYLLEEKDVSNKIRRRIIDDTCTISYDFSSWIEQSEHTFDVYATLTRIYPDRNYATLPATGISIKQAEAFCIWKTWQLNTELSAAKLPYQVEVRISSVEEMFFQSICDTKMPIPVKDKTEDWKITLEEYALFHGEVADSLCRECVYSKLKEDSQAASMLEYEDLFLSDTYQEYFNFDPSDRDVNRIHFPFKKKISMGRFPVEVIQKCSINSNDSVRHSYFFKDVRTKDPKTGLFQIMKKEVLIPSPETFGALDKGSTVHQFLTYDAAIAFYNWKYPVHRSAETVGWMEYIFPSQAEFERLKRGERVLINQDDIHFPGQLFYYTINVYPDLEFQH